MFDIEGEKIKLNADSLAIPPFKEHYNNASDKSIALKEIEYIIWLYKWNSQYLAYPPGIREKKIARYVFGKEDYKPSNEAKGLAKQFLELQNTPLIRLYTAAEEGLEYLVTTLENLKNNSDMDCMDIESKLKVAQLVGKILKDVEPTAKSLESAKKRAMAEQVDTGKVKGGGRVGRYEMPRR